RSFESNTKPTSWRPKNLSRERYRVACESATPLLLSLTRDDAMKQESDRFIRATLLFLLLFAGATNNAYAQGTTFTYQGRLQDAGTNANGSYDFQFTLWDASSAGTQEPQPTPVTVTRTSVAVTNGAFTVQLDFGASAFPGPSRFLETSVRLTGSGSFTLLSPRQPITSTPYAIRTLSAATADALSSACVSCVQNSQINS